MLAIYKAHGAAWADPFLYGLATFVLLVILGLVLKLWRRIEPISTSKNIEGRIRTWVDAFGLGLRKLSSEEVGQDRLFGFVITLRNGVQIMVEQHMKLPHYLMLQTSVLSAQMLEGLGKLSEEHVIKLAQDLRVEMARAGMGYVIEEPLKSLTLRKRVSITTKLTEDIFVENLDAVEATFVLLRETIKQRIKPISQ